MCILAFAWEAHPRWRLIAAGNRDEFHARPARPLARWAGSPILAGQDLQSGGTWLGVSAAGRFAVVTNVRNIDGPAPGLPSRGALVTDLLAGTGRFADPRAVDVTAFNPFNLIVADDTGATFLSNRPQPTRMALAPGLYGLSNGTLDEPWPKTVRLKALLADWLAGDAAQPHTLLDALADERPLQPASAPGAPFEPARSPIFIRDPVYGTRCGTVVAIDQDGNGLIIEHRHTATGEADGETALAFRWPVGGADRVSAAPGQMVVGCPDAG